MIERNSVFILPCYTTGFPPHDSYRISAILQTVHLRWSWPRIRSYNTQRARRVVQQPKRLTDLVYSPLQDRHHEDGDGWSSTFDWTDREKMDDTNLWATALQGSGSRQVELDKEIQTLNPKTWWHAHDHELCGHCWLLDGRQWHRGNFQFNFFWC